MTKTQTDNRDDIIRKKRRLDRTLISAAILAIIGLTMLQTYVVRLGAGVPMSYGLLVFFLINVNVLLLFVLLVLVLRNLYKIFFEEHRIAGAQLRTKLVIAFVSLSLVPTGLLFYAGWQFIATGHDYWFDQNVEQSLVDSLGLAQSSLEANVSLAVDLGKVIKKDVIESKLYQSTGDEASLKAVHALRLDNDLALIEIYSPDLVLMLMDMAPELKEWSLPHIPSGMFQESAATGQVRTRIDTALGRDVIRAIWPLQSVEGQLLGFAAVGFR
ncbi:MAG: hypothetical protein HQK55_17180, partial [Deltaproteobacteria bacterium]|nr:hypothetical protein [Deltaproteobacteria bacterium]